MTKYSLTEIAALASIQNVQCHSRVLESDYKPLNWSCIVGHSWTSTARQMAKNEFTCRICLIMKPVEDIRQFASTIGFTFKSTVYLGALCKHDWECPKGHPVSASLNGLQNGRARNLSLCGTCKTEQNLAELQSLAESRGLIYLGTGDAKPREHQPWKCLTAGHPTRQTPKYLRTRVAGCAQCPKPKRRASASAFNCTPANEEASPIG